MPEDVLEGSNVNAELAKRSKEAIGRLVPQVRSDRKSTKIKVQWFTPVQETKNSCVGSRQRRLSTLVVKFKWDSVEIIIKY